MVKTFQAYLPDCHRTYSCIHCRAHLANHDELISKSFQGSQGRAYLFNSVVNVGCGPAEERILLTGLHAVADIYCECCRTILGWKYEHAFESSQKYKEGKYIIEMAHMIKENGWESPPNKWALAYVHYNTRRLYFYFYFYFYSFFRFSFFFGRQISIMFSSSSRLRSISFSLSLSECYVRLRNIWESYDVIEHNIIILKFSWESHNWCRNDNNTSEHRKFGIFRTF